MHKTLALNVPLHNINTTHCKSNCNSTKVVEFYTTYERLQSRKLVLYTSYFTSVILDKV